MHSLDNVRAAGVLLHPTSLPSAHGIGDLGPEAHAHLDWCHRAGFSWWQMLPIGPVGFGDSPYASMSSFAGEWLLISLDHLVEEGLLTKREVQWSASRNGSDQRVDYGAVRRFKRGRLLKAFERFSTRRGFQSRAFRAFDHSSRSWLPDWLGYLGADPHGLDAFLQFRFQQDWTRLRDAARARGVRLIGDVPIFVDAASADVVANQDLFRLDKNGKPTAVTGVPPDCFSALGQRWGHPHYRWDSHKREKFAWWIARMRIATQRFDLVRIDHFIAFHHAYEIPASCPDATVGKWKRQPGNQLLAALRLALGPLPFIAEDLGAVTPEVIAMRDRYGLPGMRVLHHAFWSGQSADLPHNHPRHSVAYSGTHDNNTTIGWWKSADAAVRTRVRALGGNGPVHEVLARLLMESPAALCILPMQDILGLGGAARMNCPATASGNWQWRMESRSSAGSATRWRSLLGASGRVDE